MNFRKPFCLSALLAPVMTLAAQTEKPNIIFILCDDMGYGDLHCYGQPYISTPNIDKLASEGMRFTQAYSGSPVSAPSRCSLMTGQHTGHCLVRGNKEYWEDSGTVMYGQNADYKIVGQEPYDPNVPILPEVMKRHGYTTALFGKWAGGYEGSVSTPDKRGFDEFYGYICQYQAHLYFPNFLNRYSKQLGDTGVVRVVLEDNIKYPMFGSEYSKRTQYSADLIHQAAMKWIDNQTNDKPFFGMFTYTLPHAELRQPEDSILTGYERKFANDKTFAGNKGSRYNPVVNTHANFAAMITRLDKYVGEIEAELQKKGLDKNTIIIFASDNGPHEEGGADPKFFGRDGKLRGLKRQCYEGGIRIPFIVKWPDKVKAGTVNSHQLAFYDVMPTLKELMKEKSEGQRTKNFNGAKTTGNTVMADGLSFLPTLLGKKGQHEHKFLYWEFHETDQIGVRTGDWKMVVIKGVPHLYNLRNDIHEDHDMATKYPLQVKKMIDVIKQQHIDSPDFKITLPY
jgi:arylsulfatase A-like enzyme